MMKLKLLYRAVFVGVLYWAVPIIIALIVTSSCGPQPPAPTPTNTLVVRVATFTPSPTAPSPQVQIAPITPTASPQRVQITPTALPQQTKPAPTASPQEMHVTPTVIHQEAQVDAGLKPAPTPAAPPFTIFNNITLRPLAATGRAPAALALLDGRLYVACRATGNVLIIENGAVSTSITVGKWPAALVADPRTAQVYVANEEDDTVSVIRDNRVIHTISTGEEPTALVVLGNTLYVGSYHQSTVTAYNAETWELTDRVELGGGGVLAMAVDADAGRIYVSLYNKTFILDTAPLFLRGVVELNSYRTLGVNSRLQRFYVNNYDSSTNRQNLVALDGATGEIIAQTLIGSDPRGIAVNEGNGRVYVTSSYKDAVYFIDGVEHTALFSVTVGLRPDAIMVDEVAGRVYVANYDSHNVMALDGETGDILNVIPLTMLPRQIAVNERTGRAYVTNASTNSVFVLDVGAQHAAPLRAEIPVGAHPRDIAVDEYTGRVYVVNYASGTATVIDGNTNEVIATIPVNRHPNGVLVDAARGRVYVGDALVDAATHEVVRRVTVTDVYGGEQVPVKMVLGDSRLYLVASNGVPGSNAGNVVSAYDAEALTPTDFSNYFHRVADLAYDADAARFYVTQWRFAGFSLFRAYDIAADQTTTAFDLLKYAPSLAFNPTTKHIFVGLSRDGAPNQLPIPELLILDARGFGTVARVELPGNPGDIAVDSVTGYVYITDLEHGTVALLYDRAAPPPPTPTPTYTPTPYRTWTPEPRAQEYAMTPTPMPTFTPIPTPTEEPTPTPCPRVPQLDAQLTEIWAARRDRLSCMQDEKEMIIAEEAFERGRMFWRSDSRYIYVLYDDGRWQGFADTWEEGMDEYLCPEVSEPHTPPTPKRGFGRVWCAQAGIRDKIGLATAEEGAVNAQVVDCNLGVLLKWDAGMIYAIYDDGGWEQF